MQPVMSSSMIAVAALRLNSAASSIVSIVSTSRDSSSALSEASRFRSFKSGTPRAGLASINSRLIAQSENSG